VLVATMRRRNLGQKVKRCDEIPVSSWWASVRNEGIVQVCNLTSFEEYLPSYIEQCSSLERCCLCDYAPKKNSIRALPDLYTCHFNTVHRPLSLFLDYNVLRKSEVMPNFPKKVGKLILIPCKKLSCGCCYRKNRPALHYHVPTLDFCMSAIVQKIATVPKVPPSMAVKEKEGN